MPKLLTAALCASSMPLASRATLPTPSSEHAEQLAALKQAKAATATIEAVAAP